MVRKVRTLIFNSHNLWNRVYFHCMVEWKSEKGRGEESGDGGKITIGSKKNNL